LGQIGCMTVSPASREDNLKQSCTNCTLDTVQNQPGTQVKLIRPLDAIIILLISLAFWKINPPAPSGRAERALVSMKGKKLALWDLEGPKRQKTIHHKLGVYNVSLGEGSVTLVQAPCPHQICRKRGKIDKPGESIICIPAQLSIKLMGSQTQVQSGSGQPDALSY